jgi:hypothetical protein
MEITAGKGGSELKQVRKVNIFENNVPLTKYHLTMQEIKRGSFMHIVALCSVIS